MGARERSWCYFQLEELLRRYLVLHRFEWLFFWCGSGQAKAKGYCALSSFLGRTKGLRRNDQWQLSLNASFQSLDRHFHSFLVYARKHRPSNAEAGKVNCQANSCEFKTARFCIWSVLWFRNNLCGRKEAEPKVFGNWARTRLLPNGCEEAQSSRFRWHDTRLSRWVFLGTQ